MLVGILGNNLLPFLSPGCLNAFNPTCSFKLFLFTFDLLRVLHCATHTSALAHLGFRNVLYNLRASGNSYYYAGDSQNFRETREV